MVVAVFDNSNSNTGLERVNSEEVLRYYDERKHVVQELSVKGQVWQDEAISQFEEIVRRSEIAYGGTDQRICLQRLSLCNNGLTPECGESLARILDSVATLRELDLSDNRVESEGLKKLSRALATERCALRTLNLFNNHLGKGCAKQIALILKRNRSIDNLNLGKNRLNNKKCIETLQEALCENAFLQRLDLSQNKMGNAGATQLSAVLNPQKSVCPLVELNLTNNNLTESGVEHIIGTIWEFGNVTLKSLNLSHNKLGSEGVKFCALYLEHTHTLESLILSSCHVGDEGVGMICQGLSCKEFCSTSLRHLDLGWNCIHDQGAKDLAVLLEHDDMLETLDLTSNGIGSEGAQALSLSLRKNLTLAELNLTGNQIRDFGAAKLADFVCSDQYALESLKCDANKGMTDAGRRRLAAAFRFRQAKQTWLGDTLRAISTRRRMPSLNLTRVGDEEMMCLSRQLAAHRPILPLVTFKSLDQPFAVTARGVEVLAKEVLGKNTIPLARIYLQNTAMGNLGAAAIAQSLVHNQNLTVLSLTSCGISDEGAKFLANMLRRNRILQRLDLKGNQIGDRGAQDLFAAVSDPVHPTLYSINLSHNQLTDNCFLSVPTFEPLKQVHLGDNAISDRGALDLAKVCMSSPNLERFHVPGNRITDRGIRALNLFLPRDIQFFESGRQHP